MPDTYTQTTTVGFGKRIMNSIGGVVMGVAMFFGSFGVLYWNEGRVDISDIAKKSEAISAETVDAGKDGAFVSMTGKIMGSEDIGDGMYLKPGPYLIVTRTAEMYAWEQESESQSQTNLGGSETTTTTYNYQKAWTASPSDSSAFEYPEGHENPAPTQEYGSYNPETMTVGAYSFNGQEVSIGGGDEISLTPAMVELPKDAVIQGRYIYLKGADPAAPKVGDERVSFSVLKEGMLGTIFGEVSGSEVTKFTDKKGNGVFRVFEGGRDEALATMHGEYKMMLWIFRLVGFLLMWAGMMAVTGPFSTLLDILPFLGGTSRAVIGGVTLLVALALSSITIIVSAIVQNIFALVIVAAIAIAGVMFLRAKQKASPAKASK